jgi:hypothetical protein
MTVNASARNALKALLDEAERRNYDPPAPGITVSELEWIIANTYDPDNSPVAPEEDSFYRDS